MRCSTQCRASRGPGLEAGATPFHPAPAWRPGLRTMLRLRSLECAADDPLADGFDVERIKDIADRHAIADSRCIGRDLLEQVALLGNARIDQQVGDLAARHTDQLGE